MGSLKLFGGELLEFPTPDGFLLHGFLMSPSNARACIISLHGMRGNFYRGCSRSAAIAHKLRKRGVAVFAMNTRGHDAVSSLAYKRPGRFGKLVGTSYERFEDCADDISGAIRALRELGFRKFFLMGSSTGSQKIAYYQYKKRDKAVAGLVLLSPMDDYNLNRKRLGKRFGAVVRLCRLMVRKGKGSEMDGRIPMNFTARRFLSFADPRNAEARLFNYDGELREFSKITVPVCAVFGSRDESAVKPVRAYARILEGKTRSVLFRYSIVSGAGHAFSQRDEELAEIVSSFVLEALPRRVS